MFSKLQILVSHNLSNSLKITPVSAAVASGGTDVVLPAIKLAGFAGLMIIVTLGALAAGATPSLKLKGGKMADGTDAVDLFDGVNQTPAVITATAADGTKTLTIDANRPAQKCDYIVPVITRGGAGAAITSALSILYNPSSEPVPQGATSAGTLVITEPRPA